MSAALRVLGAAALTLLLVTVAPAVGAQGPSPQVDRGSPAGIEYQLPIQRAREKATGDPPPASARSGEAPRFGVGIPEAAGTPAGSADDGAKAGAKPVEAPRLGVSTPETVRAQPSAAGDTGGGLLPIGAAGGGALLLGALAGLGWRRRRTVRR